MPPDVLAINLFMFGLVSILGCAVIEKLDRMTEPNYINKRRLRQVNVQGNKSRAR